MLRGDHLQVVVAGPEHVPRASGEDAVLQQKFVQLLRSLFISFFGSQKKNVSFLKHRIECFLLKHTTGILSHYNYVFTTLLHSPTSYQHPNPTYGSNFLKLISFAQADFSD